jgi:hypothetical protein
MYVYMPDCDAYNFVTNNSAFVLTLIGLVGAGFSGLAMCILGAAVLNAVVYRANEAY